MTITLKTSDAVADFLEHVAVLVRQKVIKQLSIDMADGRPSRVTIVFAFSPPAEEVEALKKLEEV